MGTPPDDAPTDDAEPAPLPDGEEEMAAEEADAEEPAAVADQPPAAAPVDAPAAAPVDEPGAETIARYVSAGSVLVRFNAKTNDGMTALELAIQADKQEVVDLLKKQLAT